MWRQPRTTAESAASAPVRILIIALPSQVIVFGQWCPGGRRKIRAPAFRLRTPVGAILRKSSPLQ